MWACSESLVPIQHNFLDDRLVVKHLVPGLGSSEKIRPPYKGCYLPFYVKAATTRTAVFLAIFLQVSRNGLDIKISFSVKFHSQIPHLTCFFFPRNGGHKKNLSLLLLQMHKFRQSCIRDKERYTHICII